jgi:hypothetical protein
MKRRTPEMYVCLLMYSRLEFVGVIDGMLDTLSYMTMMHTYSGVSLYPYCRY